MVGSWEHPSLDEFRKPPDSRTQSRPPQRARPRVWLKKHLIESFTLHLGHTHRHCEHVRQDLIGLPSGSLQNGSAPTFISQWRVKKDEFIAFGVMTLHMKEVAITKNQEKKLSPVDAKRLTPPHTQQLSNSSAGPANFRIGALCFWAVLRQFLGWSPCGPGTVRLALP